MEDATACERVADAHKLVYIGSTPTAHKTNGCYAYLAGPSMGKAYFNPAQDAGMADSISGPIDKIVTKTKFRPQEWCADISG